MDKLTIRDLPDSTWDGKRVFVRADLNVPLQDGIITDDSRIQASIPTIQYLSSRGAKVILASHLGRPNGTIDDSLRLTPVAQRLSELLGHPVQSTSDVVGPAVTEAVNNLNPGNVILLENVRFESDETNNGTELTKSFAALADIFVQDAFGTAHRAHSSTQGIGTLIPAYAGLLVEKELHYLGAALESPKRPFLAIIGGSKISSKFAVLRQLIGKVDTLFVGGAMSFTLLKAQGNEVGTSMVEDSFLNEAKLFLDTIAQSSTTLILPEDQVLVKKFAADAETRLAPSTDIQSDEMGLDAGPQAVKALCQVIEAAGTVIWNGPLGVFEMDAFAKGTIAVAKALEASNAISIVGGGDSVAAVNKAGVADGMSHISTGGGASLSYLEGQELPGVAVLKDR
ncbi:phosphoglycerate kinase [bacterium]|nr:phosphoglycerate kinase [bacterium]